jgi:hypothetical protein
LAVKKSFWKIVNDVLEKADIILLVGDARAPDRSFNIEVIHKAQRLGKRVIKVLNKVDLLDRKQQAELRRKYPGIMVISATEHLSTMRLLRLINMAAKNKKAVVGVLGYPNTGKSSVINAIKGRASTSVSPIAGHTKGKQLIRVTKNIMLMDTPGVIPYQEKDELLHVLIAAKSPEQLRDVEDTAMDLIKFAEGRIEKFYGVEALEDIDETLDSIAVKIGMLKKGGKPDSKAAARRIIRDWQKGKLK